MTEFSAASLRPLAGDKAYQRGERYFAEGRVRVLQRNAHAVDGEVAGTYTYRSHLSWEAGHISFECDCPVGDEGDCCKHVVALALAAEQAAGTRVGKDKPAVDISAFLHGQPAAWLADTLLTLSHDYPEIQRRLQVQQQLAGTTDPAALKKSVSAILGRARFLDYRQSREYARKLHELSGLFRQLLAAGKANVCVPLCEYALERLFAIYAQSDDSSGAIGGEIHHIGGLYREACSLSASGDPAFPRRLFKLMLSDEWGMVRLEDFTDILGQPGLAEWESALEAAWGNLIAELVQPGGLHGKSWRIKHMMEALAQRRGDVDLLIRLYGSDLSYPNHYSRIVEVCREHGRQREAVQWAERALKAFPRDNGLRSMLAELYQHDGLDAEALELLWQNFLDQASPENYLKLKQASGDGWPEWRVRAQDALQTSERKYFERNTRYPRAATPDCTVRVRCLLAEDALEEARDAVGAYECSPRLKLELARRIAGQYPEEAAAHFQSAIPATIALGNNGAYAEAVSLLREMQPWLSAEAYCDYVAALRLQFKAKRNFIKLLDMEGGAA